VAEAEGLLDHDGADLATPVRMHVRATKRGDTLVLDFSGCGPQTRGPVNVCAPTTQACALLAVIAATDPDIPMNAGLLDAVEFVMPPGTVVSPRHPATMNLYFPTAHLAYNCVLSALGKLHSERAVAPSGLGTGALAIGYAKSRSGKRAVQYELMVTALGGTSSQDGASLVLPMNHFTPSTPVEILETEYPVMVRRYDVWRDSAGAGEFRGQCSQFTAKIRKRAGVTGRLSRGGDHSVALDLDAQGGHLCQNCAQVTVGRFQARRHAGMIPLIEANGAQEHMQRAQKLADQRVYLVGSRGLGRSGNRRRWYRFHVREDVWGAELDGFEFWRHGHDFGYHQRQQYAGR